MKPYSRDLRERVLEALEADSSSLRVAARFGVSGSFVRKLRLKIQRGDSIEPQHGGGREQIVG
jgi:transposase